MAKIEDLAPNLIAAGLTPKELKHALRPKDAPKPVAPPPVPPKRWRMVYTFLVEGKKLEDAARQACVSIEVATIAKAEVDAVRAKLANLDPVPADAPPEEEPPDTLPAPAPEEGGGG